VSPARLRCGAAALAVVALAGCGVFRRESDVGAALAARRLMVPVAGVRPADVPDTFVAPRDGGARRHGALDIPAPRGTPVVSTDDGMVLAVRTNRLGGRVVYATDPDRRFVYYYAHLDRPRDGLRPGTRLARGDLIGTVGTTGNADRREPHLHFQVLVHPGTDAWWDGRPIDPRPYLVATGVAR
jgi:murein DD-endopeptidase MepM/ murein hydrolase activator NlpD